jgi:hypothetical protein
MVEEATLNQAWGALRIVLRDAFSFYGIKEIAGLAGIDVTRLAHVVQRAGGGASKGQLITVLDGEIRELDERTKSRILTHIAEEIVQRRPGQRKCLDEFLEQLGWRFVDKTLLPIELLDVAELAELPDTARPNLVKAAARLRDGDLDGALTSACAAVDSVTNAVYAEKGLSSQSRDGFQARCMIALKAKGTITEITSELIALGWEEAYANTLTNNLRGALNQGAYVMQALRSGMSDVHGSKYALRPLVFDSLKWAALIVRMLK